jgi:hypothetical protein
MREPREYETQFDLGLALGCDRDVRLWYFYTPEQRGRYSGPPEDCYPDEPAEVEFTKFEIIWEGKAYEVPLDMIDPDALNSCINPIIKYEEDARAEAMADAHERSRGCDYTDDWP